MHLDASQMIIEDVCPCEAWAGYQAPKFVFLVCSRELYVDALSEVLHGFPITLLFMSL